MDEKKSKHRIGNKIRFFVLICFFLSGFTGLVYEILWTRMIVKIVGSAPFSISIILTVFMGGLGLGSYLASRSIDRIKEPMKLVRLYGLLELTIGGYCFVLPMLLLAFRPLYAVLYNQLFNHSVIYNFLTFVGCGLLLIVPVICMGATLPVLCRFYVTKLSHLGTNAGRLYGLNTVGAALGALLCGFWLIDVLGMTGALLVAVLINGTIGLSCIRVSRKNVRIRRFVSKPKKSEPEEAGREDHITEYPVAVIGALIIFAVSGFCAMAYEVIWTRLLGLIVGPTTYSFTIVLVTFITCLALGSMFFGWLGDKTKKPMQLLIYTQLAAALFVLLVSQILGNSQFFFTKLLYHTQDNFVLMNILKAGFLFGFMFLPTFCLGATFPLVGKIYTKSLSNVGHSIGTAYAINTIGAVLGSFCADFVIVPLIGKEGGISLIVGLQILNCLVIAMLILAREKKIISKKLAPISAMALAGFLLCFHFPMWNRNLLSSGKYHRFDELNVAIANVGWSDALLKGPEILNRSDRGEVVYYGDGIGGFTTVVEYPKPLGGPEYMMKNSGKSDASSRGDMVTQTLLTHFPMLFHSEAKTVMVLGLASGITAGEVLYYPVEQLDILEISKQTVEASEFFLPWNNNVLSNPKTNLIIQDGRAHLQLSEQKYDVIISEPSNPWMAGLAALFTREFFDLAKNRLNEDGIFVQFLHAYEMDWSNFALIGRTFADIFPNSLLVSTTPSFSIADFLLVGFNGQNGLSLENARQNLSYIQQSENITIQNPEILYRLVVSEDLQKLFGTGPINTDNRPRLEFAAPKMMYYNDTMIDDNIQSRKWLSPATANIAQKVITDIDAQIDFAEYALSLYNPFSAMVDISKATPSQKQRYFELVKDYYTNNPIDFSIFNDEELKQQCLTIQIEAIEEKIALMPEDAALYSYIAKLYSEKGLSDQAIEAFNQSLRINPDSANEQYNLGIILLKVGDFDAAVVHFNKALQINPDFAEAYSDMGVALTYQGKLTEAVTYFNKALQIKPDYAPARDNLDQIRNYMYRINPNRQ